MAAPSPALAAAETPVATIAPEASRTRKVNSPACASRPVSSLVPSRVTVASPAAEYLFVKAMPPSPTSAPFASVTLATLAAREPSPWSTTSTTTRYVAESYATPFTVVPPRLSATV